MKHDLYGYVQPSVLLHGENAVAHTLNGGRLNQSCEDAIPSTVSNKTVVHNFDRNASGFPVRKEKEVVHCVNRNGLLRHYEKTMPIRSTVLPEPKIHAFNPAEASLALGMG